MSHSHPITSEDAWLVQCLFLASFGAALFFGTSSGWIAQNFGVVPVSANQSTVIKASGQAEAAGGKKAQATPATTEVVTDGMPAVVLTGIPETGTVSGSIVVGVLPKGLADVTNIDVQLGTTALTPKESGGSTFLVDTTQWSDGSYTLIVTVEGMFEGEEILLRDTKEVVIANEAAAAEDPKKKTMAQEKAMSKVFTVDNLNVRSTPGGVIVGVQGSGGRGIVAEKEAVVVGQYRWVYVEFENGLSGYVAQPFLAAVLGGESEPVAKPTPGTSESAAKQAELVTQLQQQILLLEQKMQELEARLAELQL